jgi:hypothetical protein
MVVDYDFCYNIHYVITADGEDCGEFRTTMDMALRIAENLTETAGVKRVFCSDAETGEIIFIATAKKGYHVSL